LATIDIVLKGEAVSVTDEPTLDRLAACYREGGWLPASFNKTLILKGT